MSPTEQARGDSGKEPKLPLRQNGEKKTLGDVVQGAAHYPELLRLHVSLDAARSVWTGAIVSERKGPEWPGLLLLRLHHYRTRQTTWNQRPSQFSTRERINFTADSFTHCKLLWRHFEHIKHDGIVALLVVSARAVHRHGAVTSLNMRKKQYEDNNMSSMKYYRFS